MSCTLQCCRAPPPPSHQPVLGVLLGLDLPSALLCHSGAIIGLVSPQLPVCPFLIPGGKTALSLLLPCTSGQVFLVDYRPLLSPVVQMCELLCWSLLFVVPVLGPRAFPQTQHSSPHKPQPCPERLLFTDRQKAWSCWWKSSLLSQHLQVLGLHTLRERKGRGTA